MDKGASASADRAVVNGAGQAVSTLRASVPSAVTKADALAFIGEACRNWMETTLDESDVEDARVALASFLARRIGEISDEQTIDQLRADLKLRFAARASATHWATDNGVTDENILSVLAGRREPGPKLLALLGYERVTRYRRAGAAL